MNLYGTHSHWLPLERLIRHKMGNQMPRIRLYGWQGGFYLFGVDDPTFHTHFEHLCLYYEGRIVYTGIDTLWRRHIENLVEWTRSQDVVLYV